MAAANSDDFATNPQRAPAHGPLEGREEERRNFHRAEAWAKLVGAPSVGMSPKVDDTPAVAVRRSSRGDRSLVPRRLFDLAKRGGKVAKGFVSDVVKFVRENPHVVAGAAIGAITGASIGGPVGFMIGAGLGAAAGAGARTYLEWSAAKRRGGQNLPPAHHEMSRPADIPLSPSSSPRNGQMLQTPAQGNLPRHAQETQRSHAYGSELPISAQVASSAALQSRGTERSSTFQDSTSRPAVLTARGVKHRRSI